MTKETHNMEMPAPCPDLPPEAVTFDATEFGNFCSWGFNPYAVAGVMRGVPVKFLQVGRWLCPSAAGRTGTTISVKDANDKVLGWIHVPSLTAASSLPAWPMALTFTPNATGRPT